MNEFGGFVIVHRLNLSLGVLDIRTLNLEILDEHDEDEGETRSEKKEEDETRSIDLFFLLHDDADLPNGFEGGLICRWKMVLYIEEGWSVWLYTCHTT